jgi:geranylgeranylglycerol-phosphate geranylgeranyltransferase
MSDKIRKILGKIENYPLNFKIWLLGFSAIMVVRIFLENFFSNFQAKSFEFFVGSALVTFLFFSFSYLLVLVFLKFALKEKMEKIANVLLWGFWLAAFPPLIDRIWCGQRQVCWSFYSFDSLSGLIGRFFTFFGDNPRLGITYGVRAEVALAVLFIVFYAFLKTKKIFRSVGVGFFSYFILFILGSFPSWLTFLIYFPSKSLTSIQGYDVAGLFLSGAKYFSFQNADFMNSLNIKMSLVYALLLSLLIIFFFWQNFREKFRPVARNIRWVQITIHAGLVFFGAGLGAFYFPQNIPNFHGAGFSEIFFPLLAILNLILSAVFAWIASVFLNDRMDIEIDKITNENRPLARGNILPAEYGQLALVFLTMSLALALSVGVSFFLLIIVYQVLAWVYSCWPFRLKRFPILATFISALALILLFISGFILLSDNQEISQFPMKLFWLMAISFTISLPIKDLKDIEGDKKDGIWTIPVLLGETWGRFAIGLGIFVSYALSIVMLNAKILFVPAMIFGAISFWILQNKKISPRRVHLYIFGLLFVYVFLMAYFLFWLAIKF